MRKTVKKPNVSTPKQHKPRLVLGKRNSPRAGTSQRGSKPPKGTSTVRNLPLLLAVHAAAQFFEKLSEEYGEATEGYRAKLYEFAARCYKVGLGFRERLDQFARFKEDSFWADARQKPRDDKIMRAVLVFTMKARSAKLASSITKTARVLDSLAAQGIKPDEVAKRLKAGGGILKMYADLSPNRSDNGRVPDDLEMLNPGLAEDGEDVNGDDDEDSSADARRDPENPVEGHEDLKLDADNRVRESPSMTRAASDSIKITDVGGEATPPQTPRSRTRFDPNKDLGIEVGETALAQVLSKPQRIVIVADVGDKDETGWRPVKVMSLEYMPLTSRPYSKPEPKASNMFGVSVKVGDEDLDDDDDGWPKEDDGDETV